MMPLEAARQLADPALGLCYGDVRGDDARCGGCGIPEGVEHFESCPWRVQPQIVTALEAAQALADDCEAANWGEPPGYVYVNALVVALKGETP